MTTDDQQPNEIDIPRLARIYDATAAFYDEVVAQQQARAKLAALQLLARRRGERCLEVGVGTGWAFVRLIAGSGVEGAFGLDAAPGMLTVARQRLRDEAAIEPAPLLLGDALRLPFADASFDCLLSSYTLEVLPTPARAPALREWRRVLQPGGRIVVVNLTPGEGADAAMTDDWQRRYRIDPESFGGARPLQASSLLSEAGFEDVTRRYVGPEWPSELLRAVRP